MSGIYGIVRFDGEPVTPATLEPMATAMSRWGPDGHGRWCGGSAGLGHLMLHVTPESLHERLPASLCTASHLVITADARIDNREELFDSLGVRGAGREKTPDSSLILLAYERWGSDCVKRLLGDFAFAIWDARERTLFCARDIFGCKPFVYHSTGRQFVFGSDIKAVLARAESPKLNETLLAAYLQYSTYHAEKRHTFFDEVVKLPPAHTLLVSAQGLHLSSYWVPEGTPTIRLANGEYAECMQALFEESVRCRLRSAFPIGAHLSGGLDSSAISVAAARRLREDGRSLAVFSWSPAPEPGRKGFDPRREHLRIEEICRAEKLECQYVPVTTQNYFDLFRTDMTIEPTEMMAREGNVQTEARTRGLRVILSGWGGDEAVSSRGAGAFAEFSAEGDWQGLGRIARNRGLAAVPRELLSSHLPDSVYAALHSRARVEHKYSCIRDAFAQSHKAAVRSLRNSVFRPQMNVRNTMIHRLEYGHLVRRLEDWTSSGAHSNLVYRFPLLDRRIVEFALGIPAAEFCKLDGCPPVFQRAATHLLPGTVDWSLRKAESAGISAMKQTYSSALRHWAERIYRESSHSPRVSGLIAKGFGKLFSQRLLAGQPI